MRDYKIQNIELASAIMTAVGFEPEINFDENLATFTFPNGPEVWETVVDFESGLMLDAKKLLANRLKLYRRIRRGGA